MSSALVHESPASALASAPASAPVCGCGETLPPNGRCLAVGTCADADTAATRGAARTTAKYRPAAWTISGGVD